MNYIGEYTGPYWSNGEIQESVEWGEVDPQSELDWLSRQHDSAYAKYKDRKHREAADLIYMREAKELAGRFPEIAGNLVGYGNYSGRQINKLFSDVGTSVTLTGNPLPGLLWFGIENIIDSNDRINGTYLSKETKDIQDYYKTDPHQKPRPKARIGKEYSHNEQSEGRIRGRDASATTNESRGAIATPTSPNTLVTPLGKLGTVVPPEPVAVGHSPWFHRLKKKKKKPHRVEPLEDRVQRLALHQRDLIQNFNEKQEKALKSKPKKKNKLFGLNRVDAVRERALRDKNKKK